MTTGESTASIVRRGDDQAWSEIKSALQDGGHLRIYHKVGRAAVEGVAEFDRRWHRTISVSRVRRLERDGVLESCGVDKYRLVEGRG